MAWGHWGGWRLSPGYYVFEVLGILTYSLKALEVVLKTFGVKIRLVGKTLTLVLDFGKGARWVVIGALSSLRAQI